MRPEFGCGVHDFVFDSIDATTVGRMELAIRDALDRWEPRVIVETVEFDLDEVGRRPADHRHRLPRPRHQHDAQPRLSVLCDSRGGARVRLPEIQLDDRRFQDLVSEARMKITRSCPEWTEHNVSDPGITLIELFAWMTEMTIYRLNRVPDKLHVSLLELLGIRLDGPSAAQTSLRFRLPEVAKRAAADPRRRPRSARRGRRPRSRSSSRSTSASTIPAAVPAAYVLQRGGQVKSIGLADGVAKPAGADQLAFANPPARRRRALPRLRGAARPPADRGRRRRLAGARRRREPRGPAAALGGLPGRRRVARGRGARGPHRRLQLRLRHRARSSCRRARRSSRWPATGCTGCAAGSTTRPATAAPRRPTPSRRRSTRSPPAWSARGCPPRTPRRSPRRSSASPTARRARSSRCATRRCSSRRPARRSRSRTPSPATGRAGSCATTSSARPSSTATSTSTSSRARSSSGPRSARPTAAGPSTAPCRRRARCCASPATATAAAASAT